jgi:hypothetical protein
MMTLETKAMTTAIAVQPEIIEGELLGGQNQKAISQRQADLFQEDVCEFGSDEEIIADWLQSKSAKTAKTYWSVIKQFS